MIPTKWSCKKRNWANLNEMAHVYHHDSGPRGRSYSGNNAQHALFASILGDYPPHLSEEIGKNIVLIFTEYKVSKDVS